MNSRDEPGEQELNCANRDGGAAEAPLIVWRGGVPTSSRFGDIYFSPENGRAETNHVFIDGNRLRERFRSESDRFVIGETGFGTGLNFCAAADLFLATAPSHARLHYISFELDPPSREDVEQVARRFFPASPIAREQVSFWPPVGRGVHRYEIVGRIVLDLWIGDAAAMLKECGAGVDAWFLDGFAPAKNPQMWSPEIFASMERLSRPGATLSTFTVAGAVRRGLHQAGFQVNKAPGFGDKREMLIGHRPRSGAMATDQPTLGKGQEFDVVIIGAGLAGSSAARSLARRGLRILVLEEGDAAASGASGNPAGIAMPVITAKESTMSRIQSNAFCALLERLRSEPKRKRIVLHDDGVIQLAHNERFQERFRKAFANQRIDPDFARFPGSDELSKLAGIELKHDGIFFPRAMVVDPVALAEANLNHKNIRLRCNTRVDSIERKNNLWFVRSNSEIIASAANLVCAHGRSALRFAQTVALPLKQIRGQLFCMPLQSAWTGQRLPICYDGYATHGIASPKSGGPIQIVGATFEEWNDEPGIIPEQNERLFERLCAITNTQNERLPEVQARVSFRVNARDHLPVIGRAKEPGLYFSLAHGSRGITTSELAGRLIADLLLDEPLALESSLLQAISPNRF